MHARSVSTLSRKVLDKTLARLEDLCTTHAMASEVCKAMCFQPLDSSHKDLGNSHEDLVDALTELESVSSCSTLDSNIAETL